jgi:predicted O-methyltransferase YrrM
VEIGTYTGSTTLIMALNPPDDTVIHTLDLDPTMIATHEHGLGVGGIEPFLPGEAFRSSEVAGKILQHFGDSRYYDFSGLNGTADIVLIDADHTYGFARIDSDSALRLVRPGGVIVWDDYVWEPQHAECAGVTRAVNEIARERRCHRIAGTRLAVHIAPTASR